MGFCRKSTRVEIVADAVVLNNEVYIIGGGTNWDVFTDKVFAADLNAAFDGVYDLYRKDGDAPVAPQFCSLNMRMDRSLQARWQMVLSPPVN